MIYYGAQALHYGNVFNEETDKVIEYKDGKLYIQDDADCIWNNDAVNFVLSELTDYEISKIDCRELDGVIIVAGNCKHVCESAFDSLKKIEFVVIINDKTVVGGQNSTIKIYNYADDAQIINNKISRIFEWGMKEYEAATGKVEHDDITQELEEIDEFLGEFDVTLKDYKNARKALCITLYDDTPIDDGENTIDFDSDNIFMLHLGMVIGAVQINVEDEEDGYYKYCQLCSSFAQYWHIEPAQIWLDALNTVSDMRFMGYEDDFDKLLFEDYFYEQIHEDLFDERFEIAEMFCRKALEKFKLYSEKSGDEINNVDIGGTRYEKR